MGLIETCRIFKKLYSTLKKFKNKKIKHPITLQDFAGVRASGLSLELMASKQL